MLYATALLNELCLKHESIELPRCMANSVNVKSFFIEFSRVAAKRRTEKETEITRERRTIMWRKVNDSVICHSDTKIPGAK